LRNGYACKPNNARAVEIYTESAKRGHPAALFSLGRCFQDGGGVEIDLQRVLELYEESAKRGHVMAIHNLACMYSAGGMFRVSTVFVLTLADRVTQDKLRAFTLFKQASALRNSLSLNSISFHYRENQILFMYYRRWAAYLNDRFRMPNPIPAQLMRAIEK
jgi:TPR repeat protein